MFQEKAEETHRTKKRKESRKPEEEQPEAKKVAQHVEEEARVTRERIATDRQKVV